MHKRICVGVESPSIILSNLVHLPLEIHNHLIGFLPLETLIHFALVSKNCYESLLYFMENVMKAFKPLLGPTFLNRKSPVNIKFRVIFGRYVSIAQLVPFYQRGGALRDKFIDTYNEIISELSYNILSCVGTNILSSALRKKKKILTLDNVFRIIDSSIRMSSLTDTHLQFFRVLSQMYNEDKIKINIYFLNNILRNWDNHYSVTRVWLVNSMIHPITICKETVDGFYDIIKNKILENKEIGYCYFDFLRNQSYYKIDEFLSSEFLKSSFKYFIK